MSFKGYRRKRSWTSWRYFPGICLKEQRKTMKNFNQDNMYLGRNSNRVSPEYKLEASPHWPTAWLMLLLVFYYSYHLHNSWHKYTTRFPSRHISAWWGHLHVHWGFTIAFSLSATLPTLASVYTLGVRGMYVLYMPCVVKCIAYGISEILKY
jgi:hypothetical protein